jgi:23S rRNA (uracil1939-C5)-methyltransferase
MIDLCAHLQIERLGQRAEGIARGAQAPVYVPYALPGETIIAEVDGERGKLVEVLTQSPDRIAAFCPYFTICGGCAVQTLAPKAYAQWKQSLVTTALTHARIDAEVAPLVDAHGEGRRRATFHVRYTAHGRPETGFMQARAHRIVEIEACPVLAPSMGEALPSARALAQALAGSAKPLDIQITATLSGLDVDLRGHGPLDDVQRQKLTRLALQLGLARLSNHGVVVIEREAPLLQMGRAMVRPPPGAFLQATLAGEEALAARVIAATAGTEKIADLFAGVGTFSLRLTERAEVHAFDLDEPSLAALAKASHGAGLRPVTVTMRDLFRRPLMGQELAPYEAVIFDPPRAGALQQAQALGSSKVPLVVAVSCNAQTFARDAAILCGGGYQVQEIVPIDQFRHSPHVEIIGIFRRPVEKAKRKRRILG